MKEKTLNAESLKDVLWQTIKDVRSGSANTSKANAVCAGARTICSIVKLELQVAKLAGRKPTVKSKQFAALN